MGASTSSTALAPRQTLEPLAQPLDVRAAAGEELAAVAHVKTRPADDVRHEGVARHEAAAGQGGCEGADVETVAGTPPSLREVALEDSLETSLAVKFEGAALAWKRHAAGELAQKLEQR